MTRNSGTSVLLVEDNAIIALGEKQTLEKHGFTVTIAAGGEQAIRIMSENDRIDLVLMDIDLGDGMDGTEAAEIMLRDRDVPVVFLSSHSEPEVVEKTEKITSYGYIVKNSGPTVLLASIRMALRLFEARMAEKEQQESLRAANRELRKTKHLLEQTAGLARVGGWETNVITGEVDWSPLKREIHGLPEDQQPDMDKTINYYREGSDRETIRQLVSRAIETGEPYDVELRIVTGEGEERWVRTMGSAEFENGRCVRLYGTTQDIDERKRAEDRLVRQLEEKEIVLRETHHRIKNNMATVASLLELQISSSDHPLVTRSLRDAAGRVNSMRELYEKMLLTGNVRDIRAEWYIGDLADSVAALQADSLHLAIEKNLEPMVLGHRELFSLGIIVNELITNAVKHAFKDRSDGVVEIELKRHEDRVILVVRDNGSGLPRDYRPDPSGGFGAVLVGMLAEQLEGTVSFESRGGAVITVEFPCVRTGDNPEWVESTSPGASA